MTNLLGISGTLRKASTNTQLIRNAADIFNADSFTLADLNLPLYDADIEAQGIPAAVQLLADQIKAADAVIISTPEYNKSISGVLKNALDWISRTEGNVWKDKPVAILSATAGRSGGERAQSALRLCMVPFDANMLQSPEVLISASSSAFDESGKLKDDVAVKFLTSLMENLRAEI